ncbi:MAG: glycosyltransferase, partial [Erysipelotrichales bacterium]|nr:glycosyltransferase [Erysipelotrichales bacterium]
GRKGNVAEYLNAMDVLVLPSLYEGFPITLVEAQCSGLRCLVSDVITRSVDLTGNVRFFSLKESSDKWAKEAAALSEYDRKSFAEVLRDKGYDEEAIAKELEEYFLHGKTGE